MKKYLIVGVVLTIFASVSFAIISTPMLLKTVAGNARVLFPPMISEVKVNGKTEASFRCFKVQESFGGQPAEQIVIYDSMLDYHGYNEVVIVDLNRKEAGLPNAGEENYLLLWNYFLLQSESGAGTVPFSSAKFDPNDPKYVFEPNYIEFDVPSRTEVRTLEIYLNE